MSSSLLSSGHVCELSLEGRARRRTLPSRIDVPVLIHRCCQSEANAGDAVSGFQLHVGEVPRDGGMFAFGFLEFGELELRFDPQGQQSGVALGQVGRIDVEVGASNPAQRWIEAEKPRERLEHGRLAGAIGPKQKDHGFKCKDRWPRPEGLEVAEPQPRKFHGVSLFF